MRWGGSGGGVQCWWALTFRYHCRTVVRDMGTLVVPLAETLASASPSVPGAGAAGARPLAEAARGRGAQKASSSHGWERPSRPQLAQLARRQLRGAGRSWPLASLRRGQKRTHFTPVRHEQRVVPDEDWEGHQQCTEGKLEQIKEACTASGEGVEQGVQRAGRTSPLKPQQLRRTLRAAAAQWWSLRRAPLAACCARDKGPTYRAREHALPTQRCAEWGAVSARHQPASGANAG